MPFRLMLILEHDARGLKGQAPGPASQVFLEKLPNSWKSDRRSLDNMVGARKHYEFVGFSVFLQSVDEFDRF